MDKPKIVSFKEGAAPTVDVPPLPMDSASLPIDISPSHPAPDNLASTGMEPVRVAPFLTETPVSKPEENKIPDHLTEMAAPLLPLAPTLLLPPTSPSVVLPSDVSSTPLTVPPLSPQAPPWIERTAPAKLEEKEDELATELTGPKIISVQTRPMPVVPYAPPQQPRLVRAYQDQAARDMLPPTVEPQPLSVDQQRENAKVLAQQIHEERSSEGFFGKLKRALHIR